jgi:hypothetical protein
MKHQLASKSKRRGAAIVYKSAVAKRFGGESHLIKQSASAASKCGGISQRMSMAALAAAGENV